MHRAGAILVAIALFAEPRVGAAWSIAESSATDSGNPSIGTVFFYLVTRVDACGESIPGQDSGGQASPNPSPCP
jgi:hypothetical protein